MTEWRTDMGSIPTVVEQTADFDVVVVDAEGRRWRVTDCIKNASGQICSYDGDFGYEPIEHHYSDKDFRRVTHWMRVDLPDENKGRPD